MKRVALGVLSLGLVSMGAVNAKEATITYKCDQGKTFQAQYQPNRAILILDKKPGIRLRQTVSASGATYVNRTYQLSTKGNSAFLAVNDRILYRNCLAQTPMTQAGVVTGTVAYLERIALPLDATTIEVELLDVSKQDAPAVAIARQTIKPTNQVPVPFKLEYDSRKIDPKHSYVVRARILVNGNLRFTSTDAYRVITHGNPTEVNILVRGAGN